MWPIKGKNLGRFVLKLSLLNFLIKRHTRHTFNVVGIEIRKKGVIREAISNYLKAIAIDSEDEVLYCNLVRLYYGQGNHEKAIDQGEIGVEIKVRFKGSSGLNF